MKNTFGWIAGIAVLLVVLLTLPFAWHWFMPFGSYGMMARGYGYHMPMMGGYGMMSFDSLFTWLIPLGILILIGLGIAWLIKALTAKSS